MKLQEFVKIADTVYEVDAAALCDEDRLKYSRVVDFKVHTHVDSFCVTSPFFCIYSRLGWSPKSTHTHTQVY